MSQRIHCDAEGCESSAPLPTHVNFRSVPDGWREVVELTKEVPPWASAALEAATKAGLPPSMLRNHRRGAVGMPVRKSYHLCDKHPLPKWKAGTGENDDLGGWMTPAFDDGEQTQTSTLAGAGGGVA